MALNNLGLTVPAATDPFDPQGDMVKLADSLAGNVVVPVANVTERDALVATLAPSVNNPLYVHRADAPASARLEYTDNGTTWHLANPSGIHVTLEKTSALVIAPAVTTTVTDYTVTASSGITFNNASGIATVPAAGRYRVSFTFDWQADSTGNRTARVTKNGTADNLSILADDSTNRGNRVTPMGRSRVVTLAANDTLQLRIVHSATSNIGPDYTLQPLSFAVEYVGA